MSEPILEAISGPFNGIQTDFVLSADFYPGTLHAYLNGQLLTNTLTDGCVEIAPNIMSMRVAPKLGDTLHAYYQTEHEGAIGGGIMPPPLLTELIHLVPVISNAIDLRPRMLSAEEI